MVDFLNINNKYIKSNYLICLNKFITSLNSPSNTIIYLYTCCFFSKITSFFFLFVIVIVSIIFYCCYDVNYLKIMLEENDIFIKLL